MADGDFKLCLEWEKLEFQEALRQAVSIFWLLPIQRITKDQFLINFTDISFIKSKTDGDINLWSVLQEIDPEQSSKEAEATLIEWEFAMHDNRNLHVSIVYTFYSAQKHPQNL